MADRDAGENGEAAIRRAEEAGEEAIANGYKAAREYAEVGMDYVGDASDSLRRFVRREPWLALAASCAIGYVAARLMRRTA
jgi:ElaB/YqjD/DUF883 family membrane-anchored ribosome-binding protein